MNVAVNIKSSPRSTSNEDLDLEEEKDFKHTLRNWCGLFISIYDSKVYFLHQTAREFLIPRLSSPESISAQDLKWYGSISLQQAHSIVAKICTVYLDFRDFEDQVLLEQNKQGHLDGHIFLEYSARNWAAHLCHACIEDQEDSTSTILRICDPYTKRFSIWFAVYWKASHYGDKPELTALMAVSYFGFQRAATLLLDKGADPNIQTENG